MLWNYLIDGITVLWLGIFITDLISPLGEAGGVVMLAFIPVYVADLGVQYRRVGNVRVFLRKHWITILMTVPYLRVLRLARFARLIRILRVLKVTKLGRWPGTLKLAGTGRKLNRIWIRLT